MTIAGVVLAGGRSSRMGSDKALLVLGGETLVARAVARLRPQVAAVAVNANGADARLDALGVPLLPDPVAGFPGPLAGMLAGLRWARDIGASHVATVAVDTPFFPADLVGRLRDAAGENAAVARSVGRLHPTFALLPTRLADDLAAWLADGRSLRAADWIARHAATPVDFDSGAADPFFNVNRPDDLVAAEAGCVSR